MIIRNQPTDIASAMSTQSASVGARARSARTRHSSISGSSIASYFGVFLLVVTLVAVAYRPPVYEQTLASASNTTVTTKQPAPVVASSASVDQLMATNLASSLAESTGMPISNNVANLSQSLAIESSLAQTDANVISKPQVVSVTASNRSPQKYTAEAGDTTDSIGAKYGVSAQTIRWANNMSSDAVEPGRSLTILPFDGILYTVKNGDTVDGIVSKYGGDAASIIADNDLELTGSPVAGSQILVRGGDLPTNERPGYVAPAAPRTSTTPSGNWGSYGGGYGGAYTGNISVGNKYAWGNCTWYAYERRAQLGRPIGSFWGNASTWAYNARLAGFAVDGNPAPGAIMANGGGYGHVAIVESVNPGVSVRISEMNGYRFGGGFARVGNGDISWGEATSGMYQYIH